MVTIFLVLVFLISLFFILTKRAHTKTHHHRKLPPGPRPLPIIGNLHQLGSLPHRSLQKLSQKHGHIMSIKLGSVPAIIISSPEAAELFLRTHDTVFASRPKIEATEHFSYGSRGLVFAEYGAYWRSIRKLCSLRLFGSSRAESLGGLREEEVGLAVESLRRSAAEGEVVDLSRNIAEVVEDISTRMILGRRKDDDRYDLKGIADEILRLAGAFNLSDCVPWLAPLDLQGLTKRMKKARNLIDQVLERIITEHEKETNNKQGDFVDMLLPLMNQPMDNLQDDHIYTIERTNIKAILLDLLIASFDAATTITEWTISELLRNPRVMKKLQDELQSVIGMDRKVEEKDLGKLSYLDMVVKESFRLHPVVPLLVPRECMEDITIEGYYMPKKARIMVNTWAIGRDPNVWSNNVEEFYPERFMAKNLDLKGHDFELLPFGSGRRMCTGMHLGLVTVRLVLAQFVHCFDWKLPDGMKPNDIDMDESFGLSLPRANHLLVKPIYRLIDNDI